MRTRPWARRSRSSGSTCSRQRRPLASPRVLADFCVSSPASPRRWSTHQGRSPASSRTLCVARGIRPDERTRGGARGVGRARRWDLGDQLPRECARKGLTLPPTFEVYADLKVLFALTCPDHRGTSLKQMLDQCHLQVQGRQHCGIDDCRTLRASSASSSPGAPTSPPPTAAASTNCVATARVRLGDWLCVCGAIAFGSKTVCFRCARCGHPTRPRRPSSSAPPPPPPPPPPPLHPPPGTAVAVGRGGGRGGRPTHRAASGAGSNGGGNGGGNGAGDGRRARRRAVPAIGTASHAGRSCLAPSRAVMRRRPNAAEVPSSSHPKQQSQRRPGDWDCPNPQCRALVFASKTACFRCGSPPRRSRCTPQWASPRTRYRPRAARRDARRRGGGADDGRAQHAAGRVRGGQRRDARGRPRGGRLIRLRTDGMSSSRRRPPRCRARWRPGWHRSWWRRAAARWRMAGCRRRRTRTRISRWRPRRANKTTRRLTRSSIQSSRSSSSSERGEGAAMRGEASDGAHVVGVIHHNDNPPLAGKARCRGNGRGCTRADPDRVGPSVHEPLHRKASGSPGPSS